MRRHLEVLLPQPAVLLLACRNACCPSGRYNSALPKALASANKRPNLHEVAPFLTRRTAKSVAYSSFCQAAAWETLKQRQSGIKRCMPALHSVRASSICMQLPSRLGCWLQALVALVSDIQRTELTPLFKEGYLCAARCCDTQSPEGMQAWCGTAALGLAQHSSKARRTVC